MSAPEGIRGQHRRDQHTSRPCCAGAYTVVLSFILLFLIFWFRVVDYADLGYISL